MSFALPEQAATGFQNASAYDKYRPSYGAEAVSSFLTHLNVKGEAGARIAEIGAGTGKFTEVLAGRKERFEIVAVEPHKELRSTLVAKSLQGVKEVDGNAADIPLEAEWADTCIAAQAFHWFATQETLKEVNRVLRPGGTFGMIWNIEDYNSPKDWPCTTKWERALKDIVLDLEDGMPRFRHSRWKDVFDQQLETTPLETLKDTFKHNLPNFSLPLGEESIRWTVWMADEEAVWARYSTLSHIANLDAAKKAETRSQVFRALQENDLERNEKGEIALHGCTYFAWTSRI